jgi:hypothetical protein
MLTQDRRKEQRGEATGRDQDPASGRSWRKWLLVGLLVTLLAAGAGVGAYFYGKSTGEDLEAARAEGAEEGHKKGSAQGAEEGYARGFEEGRAEGYEESYAETYRHAYSEAFEDAGLEPPKKIKVPPPS